MAIGHHARKRASARGRSRPFLLAPQSSSASRFTAGAAGFLIFSQSSTRPDRYGEPSRLDTIPSQPSLDGNLADVCAVCALCNFRLAESSSLSLGGGAAPSGAATSGTRRRKH